MASRLLFRGGQVVTPGGVQTADILATGEVIEAVEAGLASQVTDTEIVDVAGKVVLPGLIDVHTHLREPGGEHKEDFFSGTCAALAGGVTTVLAMPNTNPALTDTQTLQKALALAAEKVVCDFGLYIGATKSNALEAAEAAEAVALKMYIGSSTGDLLVDTFEDQIAHFETYPGLIAAHAEEEEAVIYYSERGLHRPPICAVLSTARLIALAEFTGRHLHICHASTGSELALIRDAKARGAHITCETTPHHMFLSTEDWERLGAFGKVNPPLRVSEDVAAIWANIDVVDVFATDHAPHLIEEKQSDKPPSGMPGLETFLPLLLEATYKNRLTLQDIALKAAQRPADLFELKHKGRLEAGYHADIVIIDPDATWTISNENTVSRCGWTPFDGKQIHGRIEQVFVRANLAYADGAVRAEPGGGRQVLQRLIK